MGLDGFKECSDVSVCMYVYACVRILMHVCFSYSTQVELKEKSVFPVLGCKGKQVPHQHIKITA